MSTEQLQNVEGGGGDDEFEFVPHGATPKTDDVEAAEEQLTDSDSGSEAQHETKQGKVDDNDNDDSDIDSTNVRVQQRISELTRKRYESERRAEQAEAGRLELARKLLESQEPVVPDLPDPDEVSPEQYDAAVRKRDDAIRAKVQWGMEKQQLDEQVKQSQVAVAQKQADKTQSDIKRYNERAQTFGIKSEELQAAAQVVSSFGIKPDLAMHILGDESGPLITRYLGNNVEKLAELVSLPPIQAALYIERNIKPLLGKRVKKSQTPKPPSKATSSVGKTKSRFPLTSGKATFE